MTFRELTELQEKLRNGAHTNAIIHRVDTNGGSQMNCNRKWIPSGDGLWPEMDPNRIWIATGYGWMTGGG
jgi:hypothetical protein